MAGELRLVVVDDDEWKRSAMAERLDSTTAIRVSDAVDQDTAATWRTSKWSDVDAILVDIYDDRAPGERGTDLYSGIAVVERVMRLPVRSIAVTPSTSHPLVQLRLQQAHPDFCYHRFEVRSIDSLSDAVCFPERDHRLPGPDIREIRRFGASKLLANDAVRTYVDSPLYGKLEASLGLKELRKLGISRRQVDRLKDQIVGHGYSHVETVSERGDDRDALYGGQEDSVRWPVIRDLMLRLLGRLDAPPSEYDKPWWQ